MLFPLLSFILLAIVLLTSKAYNITVEMFLNNPINPDENIFLLKTLLNAIRIICLITAFIIAISWELKTHKTFKEMSPLFYKVYDYVIMLFRDNEKNVANNKTLGNPTKDKPVDGK